MAQKHKQKAKTKASKPKAKGSTISKSWEERKILIARDSGAQRESLKVLMCGEHLAIHQAIAMKGYAITHLPTGRAIAKGITLANARKLGRMLLDSQLDWNFKRVPAKHKAWVKENAKIIQSLRGI